MSDKTKEPVEQEQQDISELLQIRRDKLTALQQAGKDPFEITVCDRNAFAQDIRDRFEEIEGQDVVIAGRIMSWRDMGKASFMDIQDRTGRIQVYLKIDDIGEEAYRRPCECFRLCVPHPQRRNFRPCEEYHAVGKIPAAAAG